jgi:hypothetical protein
MKSRSSSSVPRRTLSALLHFKLSVQSHRKYIRMYVTDKNDALLLTRSYVLSLEYSLYTHLSGKSHMMSLITLCQFHDHIIW